MTQGFFSFLTSIIMLFSSIFGLGQSAVDPNGLANEPEPEYDIYSAYNRVDGVQDSVFYIKRPNSVAYNTVYASDFGMDTNASDNYAAFTAALDYCKAHPYTHLVIGSGKYYFRTDRQLNLAGLSNVIIDGDGAQLYFSHANYFNISGCECVELTDFSVNWNDENSRLASLIKIANADKSKHTFDMIFTELDNVDKNIAISAFTQYDAETLTPGTRNGVKENYIYSNPDIIQSVNKTGDNVLTITHNGALDSYENDDVFLLRHNVYNGNVFPVTESSNITFSNINIYSAAGMGWLITDRCDRFQLLDCTIGLENSENAEHISTTADAVHIANTNGHFRIDGCDFSFMGDDCVNVHDNVSVITAITDKNSVELYTNAWTLKPGDTAIFCDAKYNKIDFTAKVTAVSGNTVSFDSELPDTVTIDGIVCNGSLDSGNYVITNNYFHENRARALLLQSSNGLCTDNKFYRTMGNAIKIIVDISSGLWLEGTGVNTLEIKNNTFTDCNISGWGAIIDVSTNINEKKADKAMFNNIFIKNNEFSACTGEILNASNVNNLDFSYNKIEESPARIVLGKHCSKITVKNNDAPDSVLGTTIKLKSLSGLF